MSAAYTTWGEWPEAERAAFAGVPVIGPDRVREVRTLLRQHDEASAELNRHREGLRQWAGPNLDGQRLGALINGALPPGVERGMVAWREVQVLQRALDQELEHGLAEQRALRLRLVALDERSGKERAAAEARVSALHQLRPLAEQLLTAGSHLTLLVTRQAEQRGRKLAGLWGALSGQSAALQREIDQAQRAWDRLRETYRLETAGLGLLPEPRADEITAFLQRETRGQAEAERRTDAERRVLEDASRRLDEQTQSAQAHVQGQRAQAVTTWREAQRHHGVPDWPTWNALWERREAAQNLWKAGQDASQHLHDATLSLERLWIDWSPAQQDVEVLRQLLPQIEEAALARQVWEAEATRRMDERAHRAALLSSLQERVSMLFAEERAREERVRAEQNKAQQRHLEEQTRRARAAETAATTRQPAPEVVAPASPAPPHPRRDAEAGPAAAVPPGAARPTPVPFPGLEPAQRLPARALLVRHAAAAAQAAMCQEALEEWAGTGLDALRLAALVSQPFPSALAQAIADWEQVRQPSPENLTRQQQDMHERRILHWETTWAELRRTLGVPAQPEQWHRLWASRAKAQSLRGQWEQAQEQMRQQEAQMAPLWAAWPSTQQSAAALWRALEEGEASIRTVAEPPFPPRPGKQAAPLSTRAAPSDPPAPALEVGGNPVGGTLTADRPAPRPPLPGQVAVPRPRVAPAPSCPMSPAGPAQPNKPGADALQQVTLPAPQPTPGGRPDRVTSQRLRPGALAPVLPGQSGHPDLGPPAPHQMLLAGGSSAAKPSAGRWSVVPSLPALTRAGAPDVGPAAAAGAHLPADQMDRARSVLWGRDAAAAQAVMCREALNDWAGPGLDGVRLGALVGQPLPPEVVLAVAAWNRAGGGFPVDSEARRHAVYGAVQAERERAAALLGPLRLLLPAALNLITAQQEMARVRGSAVRRSSLRLNAVRKTYAAQARSLGFNPAPVPSEVGGLISDEERAFQRRLAPLEAEWQHLVETMPGAVPAKRPSSPGRGTPQWELGWAKVCRTHGLPTRPDDWERLWEDRARAQRLWSQWHAAQQQQERLEDELAALWARWPVQAQNATTLRRALEQAERAVLQVNPPGGQGERPVAEPRPSSSGRGPSSEVELAPLPQLGAAEAPAPPPVPPPVQRRTTAEPGLHPTVTLPLPGVPPQPPSADRQAAPSIPPRLTTRAAPPLPELRPAALRPAVPASPLPAMPQWIRVPGPALPGQPRAPLREVPDPATPPSRLTRRQRAEREAVRISEQYNWRRGFLLLADALDRDNWGALRGSIEREITCGMTPDEFELMLQLRTYWHEQIHFQSPYTSRYDSLPWGLGLTLIRRSAGVPCLDEMIILIERFYEYADEVCSKRALPAFAQRLGALLEKADPDVDLEYWLCAQEARCSSR